MGGRDGDAECLVSCSVVVRACEKLKLLDGGASPRGEEG